MKSIFRFLIIFSFTLAFIYVLNNKFENAPKPVNQMPPLGSFFNPFEGFWKNAESKEQREKIELQVAAIRDKVEIVLDDRLVPHIFAQNNHDLYLAQGYVTAKYRLWQMEFQTYAAAGRLSEILGDGYVKFDLYQRRIGMLYAAETAVKSMLANETTREIVEAYCKGVNAYINQLKPEDYPLEYKLLHYKPEPWTPLKCALLLKYMSYTLSTRNDDIEMTAILQKYGKTVVDELFPNYPQRHDPIIPAGTKWNFKDLKVPKTPKKIVSEELHKFLLEKRQTEKKQPGIGSNNWAISGEKSASGYPILSNDPHLTLSLPSIWFELQLVSPNVNVYGVSLPGSPCVTIGFNERVSWGVTNAAVDVLDFYEIKFKDNSLQEYYYDDKWRPTSLRVDTIKVKNKPTIYDSIYFTHHGPIVLKPGEPDFYGTKGFTKPGLAMRWLAHEASNELLTFYKLNRAKNYRDYRRALRDYSSPAQNFIFADNNKDIAITPNGRIPLRWEEQGKFILDGSNPAHDWKGWIPNKHNPTIKNPARGFVSSANQFSADTLYPYYLHWNFATYERGMRINERLAQMQKATPDSLRALQNDNLNLRARDLLPTMLKYINTPQYTGNYKKALDLIKKWKYNQEIKETGPTIFEFWWRTLSKAIWEDDFPRDSMMIYPKADKTGDLILLNDSIPSRWFDDTRTPQKKETLADLINSSFKTAIDQLIKKQGTNPKKWNWGTYKRTDILHLTRQAPFSVLNLITNGNQRIVNATGRRAGPSWRMVVALGKQPKGYGIYPGGQSGNPGSFFYDNFIKDWQQGKLAKLLYLQSPNDKNKRLKTHMTLIK